jgi:serine protease Do
VATAVNPGPGAGISIGSAVGAVAEWLQRITVRVRGPNGSHGSGIVWRPEGLIVTNAHVAGSQVHEIELADGRTLEGWLVARDSKRDLAALALNSGGLPAPSVRSARTLRAGELVIAIGNPWDGVRAVSTGIVHHASGNSPWLMADIRLAPGNSGGPLADAQGNVIGVNSMIVGGFGCAVTSDAVEQFLQRALHLPLGR